MERASHHVHDRLMKPTFIVACIAAAAALITSEPARAEQHTYTYTVAHPSYGEIGTYTDVISEADGVTRIDSRLRVAVQVLGIVLYREEGDRSEIWHGGQLVSFESVSNKNGERIEVRGKAEKDGFVITSPSGTTIAPVNVEPSDPWAIKQLGAAVMVSTKSGKIQDVNVTGGEASTVSVEGKPVLAHHFHVEAGMNEDRWEVWFDKEGVPVKFQSVESGEQIDFILGAPSGQTAAASAGAPGPAAHAVADNMNNSDIGSDGAPSDMWNARTSAPAR